MIFFFAMGCISFLLAVTLLIADMKKKRLYFGKRDVKKDELSIQAEEEPLVLPALEKK
jgi:hypothetical protein